MTDQIILNGRTVTDIPGTIIMKIKMHKSRAVTVSIITAALLAAVIFVFLRSDMTRIFTLPSFAEPTDKTVGDDDGSITVTETGRDIAVYDRGVKIWELPPEVRAQDFLFEDIDRDGQREAVILCWKRGRFGKHRPTWVKRDEIGWSQHIYIFEIDDGEVKPKWMASDIGMDAAHMGYEDGAIVITDTDGIVTKWKWISWGLEKM